MNRRNFLCPMAFLVMIIGWFPAVAGGQATPPDQMSIQGEILSRYSSFEGSGEEQTWEKWQDYFMRSPDIANLHGTHLEIGWETYREGSLAYYDRPAEDRAAVRFEDLQVHLIDESTAWVTGVFVNIIGEREMRPLFYDVLKKTSNGWQVFFSYVAPHR